MDCRTTCTRTRFSLWYTPSVMRLTFAVRNVGSKLAEFKGCYPAENSCLFNTNTVTTRNTNRANSIVSTIIHRRTHCFLNNFCTTRECGSKVYTQIHSGYDLVSHTIEENRMRGWSIFRSCPSTYYPSDIHGCKSITQVARCSATKIWLKRPWMGLRKKCLGRSTKMQNARKIFRKVFPKWPSNLRRHRLKPFSRTRMRISHASIENWKSILLLRTNVNDWFYLTTSRDFSSGQKPK